MLHCKLHRPCLHRLQLAAAQQSCANRTVRRLLFGHPRSPTSMLCRRSTWYSRSAAAVTSKRLDRGHSRSPVLLYHLRQQHMV